MLAPVNGAVPRHDDEHAQRARLLRLERKGSNTQELMMNNISVCRRNEWWRWIILSLLLALVLTALPVLPAAHAQTSAGGTVVAWGYNYYGQTNVPSDLRDVVATAAGYAHSLALKRDGTVVAWGDNDEGQTNVPSGLSNVTAIAAGYFHSLALKGDGTVVAWGNNGNGQTNVPRGLSDVVAIAAGNLNSLALKRDGSVVGWGMNRNGGAIVPAGLSDVTAIAAGGGHSLALKRDGTVVAWGENFKGQASVPAGLSDVIAIAGGNYHSLALKRDGTVVAWGDNDHGQTNVPSGLSDVIAIAAGWEHSLALKRDGTVVAWGHNPYGETNVPSGLSDVTAIAAGAGHSLAVTTDTTAPDTTITAQPSVRTNSTSASFSFTSSEANSKFACSLDDAAFTACTSPKSYTGLADGAHTFRVRATDLAGNTDPIPASFEWKIDTVAPNTTIRAHQSNPSSSPIALFDLTGTDNSSGRVSFECSLDNAAFTACTTPKRYTGLTDGSHTFQARAIDAAGNVDATPESYTWTISLPTATPTNTSVPPTATATATATSTSTPVPPTATATATNTPVPPTATPTATPFAACYQIQSAQDNRLLTVPSSAADTALVVDAAQSGNALQLWQLRADGAIVSLRTGYLLDVNRAALTAGTAAIVYPEQVPAQANQRWSLAARDSSQVVITTQLSNGYVLDINGADNVSVILYPEQTPSQANQRWLLVAQDVGTCDAATLPTATATSTNTPVPPTATATNTPTDTATATPIPLTATATATVIAPPELDVQGNGVSIVSGDTTPSLADDTDFGATSVGSPLVRTFTIRNTGNLTLTISSVTITGANASEFTITALSASSVAAGGSTSFQLTFTPSAAGVRTATVSIVNIDRDENPYTFAVQGTAAGNLTTGIGTTRMGTVWHATPNPTYHTLGYYDLTYGFTNNTGKILRGVYYQVTAATNALLLNPSDGTPGGVGEIITVLDSTLPNGDSLWQAGETLPNQLLQVGVTSSGWKLTVAIYAVDDGLVQAAGMPGMRIGTFDLDERTVGAPATRLFLPLVQR